MMSTSSVAVVVVGVAVAVAAIAEYSAVPGLVVLHHPGRSVVRYYAYTLLLVVFC
jgi:hypothetical protein